MPKPRTLNQHFFKTWSPQMAYVFGYFAADGSMVRHENGGYFIEFTSIDRILLENLQKAVNSNHRIGERVRLNAKWKTQYRLQLGSKEWFQDLAALGFTQSKSRTLAFPKVPETYFGHFVRGYFDGDGCVYFNKLKFNDRLRERWMLLTLFTSGSQSFLEKLHGQLKEHGIKNGSLGRKERGFDLKYSRLDSLALYELMYNTGEVSDLYLPRKREKLERALQVLGLDKRLRS